MINCKICKNKEYVGSFFCSECGSQLLSDGDLDIDTLVIPTRDKQDTKPSAPDQKELAQRDTEFALYNPERGKYLDIPPNHEFTIGRYVEGQVITPDVDLNPYDAFENGISRLHATIRFDPQSQQYFVLDLGSANGTSVNNYEIPANSEVPLKHGDEVKFGKLNFTVLIPENE